MLGTKVAKLFSTLMKQSLNSINPAGEPIAIGYFFPKEWNEQYLQTVLDPSGRSISQINVLKNKIGEHSGKVILKFSSQ